MSFKIPDTPEELFGQVKIKIPKEAQFVPFILVLLFLAFTAMTSFYSVEPDEVGVIRRFGKYAATTQPGLQWKMPLGIDKLDKVKVKYVFKEEFGFRTVEAGVNTRYSQKSYNDESLMLTGDLNVLDVTWIVQFRIKDPKAILFTIKNPQETIRDISESVMRQVIGDSSVTEALTNRRLEINLEVQKRLQDVLDSYNIGVKIDTVKLQDVNPPDIVKPSFNDVNEAKQEREKVINQSLEAYNKVIPKARGQAEKTIKEAEGYALARVKKAEGDANRFVEIWNAYKTTKDVTRQRLYLETMKEVLPKAGKIYIMNPQMNQVLPLLQLQEGGK